MNPFIFQLEDFQLNFHPAFALFSGCNLCSESINGFISLRKGSAQLSLAHFKLINAACCFSFDLGLPQLDFGISLRESLESIRFLLRFLINTVLQVLKLSAQVLEPGKESSTITSLRISQSLSVFQLGGK